VCISDNELLAITHDFKRVNEGLLGPKSSNHLGRRGKTHLEVLFPRCYSEQTLEDCSGSYKCLFRLFGRDMSSTKALVQS